MAEATALALAVVGAFNDAILCFEYVQLARNFDKDYQLAILKLDIAKLRLSRWAVSVGLDRVDPETQTLVGVAGSFDDHVEARRLLERIIQLFEEAKHQTARIKTPIDAQSVSTYDAERDLDGATASLHQKLERLSSERSKRFKPTNLVTRVKWALQKEKNLNRLITNITELVNDLVELFPAAQQEQTRLCVDEGIELAADDHVSLLVPIAKEQDPELSDAIKSQESKSAGPMNNVTFTGAQNHGLQQGFAYGQQTFYFGAQRLREE